RVLSFDSNAPTFVSQEWPETTRFLLAEEETGKRFRKLVSARVVDDSAYRWIVDNGSAQTVIDTAVADYREHGNERRLSLAASLLGDMGLHAAESLRRLFSTGAAESEYFVDVAFCARDILPGELAQIAYTLATNPHADVRRRLLTNLHEHDRIDARLVLRTLCDDEEEDIACLARELFSSIS
ncbi:MAG TPA: hypothetical protein VMJ10_10410, partial [Kofleriaceae bacterium]|nr:hypothetical protein [Kofleriaceae bacterium]